MLLGRTVGEQGAPLLPGTRVTKFFVRDLGCGAVESGVNKETFHIHSNTFMMNYLAYYFICCLKDLFCVFLLGFIQLRRLDVRLGEVKQGACMRGGAWQLVMFRSMAERKVKVILRCVRFLRRRRHVPQTRNISSCPFSCS